MNNSLTQKFYQNDTPKKILSLDGGGVRGALTLGFLEKVEQIIRRKTGNENLVLGDYYDLIGGTSTGAIIASCLAIGKSVGEVIELYTTLGKVVFGRRRFPIFPRSWVKTRSLLKASYKTEVLEKVLQDNLGDTALCDYDRLKCPLVIISKRADTYSLWTVSNHPDGIYTTSMGHLKLWELCRASSAAPYYFTPKRLKLKIRNAISTDGTFDAAFIDGGVSLANNPALQLYLTVTIPSFGYNWVPGEQNLFITSFGTGNGIKVESVDELVTSRTISWAPKIPNLFMVDALEMNQTFLQLFGRNFGPTEIIDSQFGDLNNFNHPTEKLFSFARFNVNLSKKYLKDELGLEKSHEEIASLVEMDHFENIDYLLEIGRKAATKIESYRIF